jgi:hypothetical protein
MDPGEPHRRHAHGSRFRCPPAILTVVNTRSFNGPTTDTKVLWTLVGGRRILCQQLASRADRNWIGQCETHLRSLYGGWEHQRVERAAPSGRRCERGRMGWNYQ